MEIVVMEVEGEEGGAVVTGVIGSGISPFACAGWSKRVCSSASEGFQCVFYLGPATVAGCDGTSFEFRCDEILYGTSLHWWEDQPSEWRPFTAVVVQIASELESRRKGKVQSDAAPNSRPPSQFPSSPEVQASDSQRMSSFGGCG